MEFWQGCAKAPLTQDGQLQPTFWVLRALHELTDFVSTQTRFSTPRAFSATVSIGGIEVSAVRGQRAIFAKILDG